VTGRRDPRSGFSLIEVLVVLAIVAVMTGASVLGLGALDRGAGPEAEAMRLADRLRLAADEVLVTPTPLALVWDASGYRFIAWDARDAAWRDHAQAALGTAHRLPASLRLGREDQPERNPILITPDLPRPPVVLRLADAGGDAGAWRVSFDGFAATAAPVER